MTDTRSEQVAKVIRGLLEYEFTGASPDTHDDEVRRNYAAHLLACIDGIEKNAAIEAKPPADTRSEQVEALLNDDGAYLHRAINAGVFGIPSEAVADLHERLDRILAALKAKPVSERVEVEPDLGYNCPWCHSWNYLHPKELADADSVVECGNEDCAMPVRIVVTLTATSEQVEACYGSESCCKTVDWRKVSPYHWEPCDRHCYAALKAKPVSEREAIQRQNNGISFQAKPAARRKCPLCNGTGIIRGNWCDGEPDAPCVCTKPAAEVTDEEVREAVELVRFAIRGNCYGCVEEHVCSKLDGELLCREALATIEARLSENERMREDIRVLVKMNEDLAGALVSARKALTVAS